MAPDWHKIQFPQYLLIHPIVVVLSTDTAVVRTIGEYDELRSVSKY